MKVSVVMTVYSETELLRQSVAIVEKQLHDTSHEILIVVHPKSNPECLAVCRELEKQPGIRIIIQGPRSGIGWADREAIPYVQGEYALFMASDLETDPNDVAALVRKAEETGADIVCASRWARGGGFSGYSPLKFVLNYGYNQIFRLLYRTPVHDITFGFKIIRADVLRRVKWEYGTHEFCAELLLRPLRLGYKAAEIPTKWANRPEGESKMTFMRNFRFASAAWKILITPVDQHLLTEPLEPRTAEI